MTEYFRKIISFLLSYFLTLILGFFDYEELLETVVGKNWGKGRERDNAGFLKILKLIDYSSFFGDRILDFFSERIIGVDVLRIYRGLENGIGV